MNGFSILELLLVVGVFAILAAFISSAFDSWYRDSIDRKVAKEIMYLQKAAEDYARLNFSTILPPLGDTVEIDLNDLIAQNYLPSGFRNNTSHRQEMRVLMRHSTSTAVSGSVIDILTVTDNSDNGNIIRIPNNRLLTVAENFPELGIVSNLNLNAQCCINNIQSIKGLWSVPLSSVSSFYTATGNDDGGYLAAYGRVSIDEEITSNYLYRVPIDSLPQANTMEVNLDMGQNDIINGNAITSDGLTVNGNVVLEGANNGLNLPYVLMTNESMTFNSNLHAQSNDTNRGNVIIHGDDGIGADFTVTNTLTVQMDEDTNGGIVSSQIMTANTVTPMNVMNFQNADFNNTNLDAGNIYSSETRYAGTIDTVNMQAIKFENVNAVNSGNLVAESLTIDGSMTVPSDFKLDNQLNVIGDVTVTGQLNASGEMVIRNLNSCGNGCP